MVRPQLAEAKRLLTELSEKIDILDEMLSALVELLEEKGILSYDEWEERIEDRLVRSTERQVYEKIVAKLKRMSSRTRGGGG